MASDRGSGRVTSATSNPPQEGQWRHGGDPEMDVGHTVGGGGLRRTTGRPVEGHTIPGEGTEPTHGDYGQPGGR